MARTLHAVQIGFFSDPFRRPARELLDAWPSLVDVAEAATRSGVRTSVIQSSVHSERLVRNGVDYHFLPFGTAPASTRRSSALGAALGELAPDVLHVHGLGFPKHVLDLATLAPGVPIILQDHADKPPRFWHRASWRRGLSVAAGLAFCARPQAGPFVAAGLVGAATPVYEVPESTSRFVAGDREQARRTTGLRGDPAVLWVGHLNDNKDPLTVLDGISRASGDLTQIRLYCCYGSAPLLGAVQRRIAADPALRHRVHLLGAVPHEEIELLMRAADIFVLGSHLEGSGYALIEALACGLPPVVTDIPSFRSLTGAGAVGALWPCDDAVALAAALRAVAARSGPDDRSGVRTHFERWLSIDAVGASLAEMYRHVVDRNSGHAGTCRAPAMPSRDQREAAPIAGPLQGPGRTGQT